MEKIKKMLFGSSFLNIAKNVGLSASNLGYAMSKDPNLERILKTDISKLPYAALKGINNSIIERINWYNNLQQRTSEVVEDRHGNQHFTGAGAMSGADPIGLFAVEATALNPLFKLAGKGILYGLGKAGDPWARGKIISGAIDREVKRNNFSLIPKNTYIKAGEIGGESTIINAYDPLSSLAKSMKGNKSYFFRAPEKIDVQRIGDGRYRHELVGNEVLPSGTTNGKFLSYGEPWKEFDNFDNQALYEFPINSKRTTGRLATDWKGRSMDYSVDDAYNVVRRELQFQKDIERLGLNTFDQRRKFMEENYPDLLSTNIRTDILYANQTVIPNSEWNFNKFLKNPFYKYELDPNSGLIQKTLFMSPLKPKMLTSKTSLKFFERPSRISEAERVGLPRGERNFTSRWHVARYPGYLLKGLMGGSPLERQLSKNGTININLLNTYFNKASQIEREIANKVLAEKFTGLKIIDYNLFKKAVLDELINYSTKPQIQYSTYGMNRLGFNVIKEPDGAGGIIEYLPGIKTNTFTFESPRISVGNNKHYDPTTLGHSRTYTTPDEPNVLHVMESLSDWGQSHVKMMPSVLAHQIAVEKALKSGNTNAFHSFTNRLGSLLRDKLTKYERMALENINKEIESGLPSGFLTIEDLWSKKYEILKKASNRSNIGILGLHLHDNYLQRQLQENLRYAAENGLTKMRYPTSETAAKIEGYLKKALPRPTRNQEIELRDLIDKMWKEYYDAHETELRNIPYPEMESIGRKNIPKFSEMLDKLDLLRNIPDKYEYIPAHQTILKKYADFPKLFLKLFKDLKVRTVIDTKGNTWYEVDVPKGYLNREWQFKQGGKLNMSKFQFGGLFQDPITPQTTTINKSPLTNMIKENRKLYWDYLIKKRLFENLLELLNKLILAEISNNFLNRIQGFTSNIGNKFATQALNKNGTPSNTPTLAIS